MQQIIEVDIPEGYVVASGPQPRSAKVGEIAWCFDKNKEPFTYNDSLGEESIRSYMILEKNKTPYRTREHREPNEDELVKFVEVQALKDCLELLKVNDYKWSLKHELLENELKKLVE